MKEQEREKKLEQLLTEVIETKKIFQKKISILIETINKELKTIYSPENQKFIKIVEEEEKTNKFIEKEEGNYIKHINSQKEFEKIINNFD